MSMRALPVGALVAAATLVSATPVTAQIVLPVKSYETLNVELQSLRDDITLFLGDPQHLLFMDVRPNRFRPRIDYFDQTDATLRIRDLYVVDHADFAKQTPEERDKSGDPPLEEMWEIRLSPAGPTHFALQCERGESQFDFTDMEVRRVELRAQETKVDVEFASPNPIELERFAARVIAGSFRFQHMINARAKEISFDLPGSECHLEITGTEFEGDMEINCLGLPAEMQLVVSRNVGLRITGPAATIARFDAPHMRPAGEERMSEGFASAKCRVHLTFGAEIANLEVQWK